MKKRQYIIVGSVIVIISLIALAIFGNKKKEDKKKMTSRESVTYVQTNKAQITNHDVIIKGSGRLGSSRNVVLIAEVQGKLLPGEVSLKSGSRFRKDQFLFGIDDTETRLNMQARKSGFLTMLATALPDIKIDFPETFDTWEDFFERVDVTRQLPELPVMETVKGKTYLASKNILGEYYSIQADEEKLRKYKIYAPFNGNFVDVFTELGTVVNSGTQIARIIQTGNLEAQVPISVSEAHFLNVGQSVAVFVEGESKPANGQIIRIGQYINPNTQSVDVFVRVEALPKMKLYDGMYVEVEINSGVLKNVVKIPREAMIDDRNILVVIDSFLLRQQVTTTLKSEGVNYITGIDNGVEMVVEAMSNPSDSMIVKTIPLHEEGH